MYEFIRGEIIEITPTNITIEQMIKQGIAQM